LHRFAEVADDDTGKEHSCDAETGTANLHRAERQSSNADEGQNPDGMSDRVRRIQLG
jgi:hypothetical protein